jgi:hypothetical protein
LWQRFPVTVTIRSIANGRSSFLSPAEYSGYGEINIRGNSSRAHPKKSYRLEIQTALGDDLNVPLLGMPPESDWILYPAFTDKPLVRDALAYELWRAMGHYAPRTRFVELFIQGESKNATWDGRKNPPSPQPSNVPSFAETSSAAPGPGTAHGTESPESPDPAGFATLFGDWLSDLASPSSSFSPMVMEPLPSGLPEPPSWMEDYAGVYVLMEKIKRGKERVRIKRSKPDEKDPQWFTGGFIFKKDRPRRTRVRERHRRALRV